MKIVGTLLLRAAIVSPLLGIGLTAASGAELVHQVNLTALNGSGVRGNATLRLSQDRKTLTVVMNATGLEPGQVHLAHIHGPVSASGDPVNSRVPTSAQDSDGDGFVELAEGGVTYGPIIVHFGNVDPDGDGKVNFRKSFDLSDPKTFDAGFDIKSLLGAGLDMLDFREIVIHGMTVPEGPGAGTPGEVNGTNGFLLVLPVAAGEVDTTGKPGR